MFTEQLAQNARALLALGVASSTLRGERSWLAHPGKAGLGDCSYTFYLVHATVMYAVLNVIGGPRGSGWSNLIWGTGIFVVALALAAAIHFFVEAPVEKKI